MWTCQFGTEGFQYVDSVAVDLSGNVYVAGRTEGALFGQISQGQEDIFLIEYDSAGNELWKHQFGTSSNDNVAGIAVDTAGNVFLTGSTYGVFPNQATSGDADAYVRKVALDKNTAALAPAPQPESTPDTAQLEAEIAVAELAMIQKAVVYVGGEWFKYAAQSNNDTHQ